MDERSARIRIRDAALRLWATHGAAVTVRQIAVVARVSPALVMRHFGTMTGLRADVDAYVLRQFRALLAELENPERPWQGPNQAATLAAAVGQLLPPASPIPQYLGRLLLENTATSRRFFRALLAQGRATLEGMAAAGLAARGADPEVRAAFLTVNDLAVLLLRQPLHAALGFDPLSRPGMERWGREVLAIYASGLGVRVP